MGKLLKAMFRDRKGGRMVILDGAGEAVQSEVLILMVIERLEKEVEGEARF